jgi:hypothetical protein
LLARDSLATALASGFLIKSLATLVRLKSVGVGERRGNLYSISQNEGFDPLSSKLSLFSGFAGFTLLIKSRFLPCCCKFSEIHLHLKDSPLTLSFFSKNCEVQSHVRLG